MPSEGRTESAMSLQLGLGHVFLEVRRTDQDLAKLVLLSWGEKEGPSNIIDHK